MRDFIKEARAIVAAHKAEYQGVYYMKSSVLSKIFNNPITKIGSDILATATGNPEFIPLINAGETYAGTGNIGKSAISGGEALAGQELAGAVGIGDGNSILNNAVGITGDNPEGTGLPDIGKLLSSVGNSTGISNVLAQLGLTSGNNTADIGVGSGAVDSQGFPVGQATTIGSAPVGAGTGAGGGLDLSTLQNFNPDLSSATGGAAAPASVASQFTSGAAAPGASGGIMNTLKQALSKTGLSAPQALAVGGIGLDALKGNQKTGAEKSLAGNAAQENTIAQNIQNGTLNPTQQATIQQQTNDAINTIKSKYASMGLSGSTIEQQAIQQVRDQSVLLGQQVAQQAATGALNALGASDGIYQQLMNSALSGDESLMKALAAMGAAGTSAKAA